MSTTPAGLAALAGPDTRAEGEKAFGVITCRFEGETRTLRTLKAGPVRAWKERVGQVLTSTLAEFDVRDGSKAETFGDLAGLGILASDTVLDLILAYDVAGSLGGREWLEEHADDHELYVVLKAILAVHFPFVKDLVSALQVVTSLMANASSAPASSSSGPSPDGASDPTTSRNDSTKPS